jgi:hypothetical protein
LINYRLYRLDRSGRIDAAEWIEADHDEDAKSKAQALFCAEGYELWDRQRLVARVNGHDVKRRRQPG